MATSVGGFGCWSGKLFYIRSCVHTQQEIRVQREYLVFLIRLNVETGSSNQPWAFTHFYFCKLLFYAVQPTGTVRDKCCFYFFTGFIEIVRISFNRVVINPILKRQDECREHICPFTLSLLCELLLTNLVLKLPIAGTQLDLLSKTFKLPASHHEHRQAS